MKWWSEIMSEAAKSQNDRAWEALFHKYNVLDRIEAEGAFQISAAQIKEFREPRLMAKFDHHINLPQIFARNGLAILPVSRGDYVISHFKAYQPFESLDQTVTRASLPNLQSLDPGHIPSEAIAINCALASGMLADFTGEERLYPSVSGRMGSGRFDFHILNTKTMGNASICVNNSQIEIDAAFEGSGSLSLLEAKRDLSEDFLIRQLYYPFRVWNNRIAKRVRPIFLVYTNGIFSLYEYAFPQPGFYNSLVLVKHKNYSIEDTNIRVSDLWETALQAASSICREPEIPFPQADSFRRVINLCELLASRELSREQVTEEYAFNIRQTNYYTDAARYLGLVEKHYEEGRKPVYGLSAFGRRVMALSYKQRQLALCGCILRHAVFQEAFQFSVAHGNVLPPRDVIVEMMRRSRLYKVESASTFIRRSSTVSGWLGWMLALAAGTHPS